VRNPNSISVGSAVFERITIVRDRETDRPTDHATPSVTIGRIYVVVLRCSLITRAQQLLRWATLWPQQSVESGGLLCPLRGGGELGPQLTLSPWPLPTFVPSGILIHSAISPQYTNVTDRQIGQRSRGIRRTIRQIAYDYLLSFLVNVNSRELTFTFAIAVARSSVC